PSTGAGKAPPFPFSALGCLAIAVVLIASAGVDIALLRSSLLIVLGLAGLALFFYIDALKPRSRLFPARLFSWRTPVGAGMTMVAAAESIAWSILSILVANAPPRRERLIIVCGALMIAAGIAGFAYTIPLGSIPLILVCALLQGGTHGITDALHG
ncbi:MAG: MFS transporter, partial [Mesorhizobium sp.]